MSLDYPFYQELKRQKHKAAKYWRIGDCLYYIGLLMALVAVISLLFRPVHYFIFRFIDSYTVEWSWRKFIYWLVTVPLGVLIFYIGASLKAFSYQLADKDGINPNDY